MLPFYFAEANHERREQMNTLEVKHITKTYPSFKLNDVSFEIKEGSICGFIGRNGAGKTTALKGIMGLIHLDSGEVYTFGKNLYENEDENRQEIAFSMAEISYFPDAKIGLLTKVTSKFYKNWSQETYEKLCKRFGLAQNKKIKELSTGMKVKYSLAVALSHNAKLLILDEPTSGIDPVSRDEILDIFKLIVKDGKRSILFSTHITSDLDKCADHIVYIKKGKIISSKEKNDFIDDYMYITGPMSEFDSVKDLIVSHKEDQGEFTALIRAENCKGLSKEITQKLPDLDTIMVYEERKDDLEDEEFTL